MPESIWTEDQLKYLTDLNSKIEEANSIALKNDAEIAQQKALGDTRHAAILKEAASLKL